jgi:hypothetical protein
MAFADKEQFRILFLDKRNQLIAVEVQQTGHRRSHPGLSPRGGEARARTVGDRDHPRPQPALCAVEHKTEYVALRVMLQSGPHGHPARLVT